MKKVVILGFQLFFLFVLVAGIETSFATADEAKSEAVSEKGVVWYGGSFEETLTKAKAEKKQVMSYFFTDW
ncbi:hypothetical protein ACFL27_24245 [candidate division CSSED10-310 bacterium]|uniref:Uncharacterized protein n=1 Tax=candidate division CSSED10-310 bacterium TaxID=2855610 RepID=A0ABV6Z4P3_UNCC1